MENFINLLQKNNVEITNLAILKRYLEEKSVYRYKLIFEKLSQSNRNLKDTHLHDFYKYDIRIRRLLFKYLTVYEILLRGKILNSIESNFEEVEKLSFGSLIKNHYNNDHNFLKVKELRNYVFHHRMLQFIPIDEVLCGINTMLMRLKGDKFQKELEDTKKGLNLIYSFYFDKGKVKYGEMKGRG